MKKIRTNLSRGFFIPGRKYLRIMKLTFIFMLWGLISYASATYSQSTRLTFESNEATIESVFKQIESLSEFKFAYNSSKLDVEQKVSVKADNETIDVILDKILGSTNFQYKIVDRYIIISDENGKNLTTSETEQATQKVSGKVTDSSGATLPGVSVVVKGTTTGVITDNNGTFSLSSIPENAILQFSFVGMKMQEIKVGTQTTINVVLSEETIGIEEVVAVGYGTQKKVNLTGSVVSTKGEAITKSQTPNVLNSLTGILPGVVVNSRNGEPGRENPTLYIRGKSTTGNADPLIIIDGVERGNLGLINPNDIERFTVLKDASAAIYGARAANGVILVTTKRGNDGKPTFNFTYNQGFSQPTRNVKMADSYTFAKVYNEIEVGAGRSAKYTDTELQKFKDGTDPNYANTNWYDYMTKTLTPQHRTNLSATGGTEKMKYYFSIGEESQDGQFIQSSIKLKHYTIRSNVDVKVTDWLKIGLNLAGRYENDHHPYQSTGNLYSHIFLYQPNWTPYWPGTSYKTPNRDGQNILNWVTDNCGTDDLDSKGLESTLTYKLDIPWVKGLSVDGTVNYDVAVDFEKIFRTPSYVYYKNNDTYTQTLVNSGGTQAKLKESYIQNTAMTISNKINYDRSYGVHNIGVMVGVEQRETKYDYFLASRSNYISTALPQLFAGSTNKNNQDNDGTAAKNSSFELFWTSYL